MIIFMVKCFNCNKFITDMRIAVNTRLLLKGKLDGIGWFTYETFKRITNSHPEHEFIFLFDRPYSDEFIFSENITPVIIGPPARHPFLWYLWFENSVPSVLKKFKADLFISPDGYLSLKTHVPSLAVIHDINFHHRPEDLPPVTRMFYRHYFPLYAKKADLIVTVSEYSRQDICSSYSVPADKVNVVYNGANPDFRPLSPDEIIKVRNAFTRGMPYFVFVGNMHPRKNVPRLLQAYDLFREEYHDVFRLVIVGEKMFMTSEIGKILKHMKHADEVVFTGRLESESLCKVMGGATALTFFPLFEGFGIPVIEAMYCNIPVLASNVTSLPEVAGNAAIYADPYNVSAMASQMLALVSDNNLQQDLIEKGRERRLRFNWDLTAEQVWKCAEKMAEKAQKREGEKR
jgi:glycosyltransferase involved in cell wall biosynthesis